METKYWRYKAYDVNLQVIEGITESPNFVDMAVKLRREGWQLLSAVTIDLATYKAEIRLQRWQQSLQPNPQPYDNAQSRHPVARLIRWLASWPTRLFFNK